VAFQRAYTQHFKKKDRYSPLREIDTLTKFGLTPEILRILPRFQGYPGYYGDRFSSLTRDMQGYITLIDREAAYGAGILPVT